MTGPALERLLGDGPRLTVTASSNLLKFSVTLKVPSLSLATSVETDVSHSFSRSKSRFSTRASPKTVDGSSDATDPASFIRLDGIETLTW